LLLHPHLPLLLNFDLNLADLQLKNLYQLLPLLLLALRDRGVLREQLAVLRVEFVVQPFDDGLLLQQLLVLAAVCSVISKYEQETFLKFRALHLVELGLLGEVDAKRFILRNLIQ